MTFFFSKESDKLDTVLLPVEFWKSLHKTSCGLMLPRNI